VSAGESEREEVEERREGKSVEQSTGCWMGAGKAAGKFLIVYWDRMPFSPSSPALTLSPSPLPPSPPFLSPSLVGMRSSPISFAGEEHASRCDRATIEIARRVTSLGVSHPRFSTGF